MWWSFARKDGSWWWYQGVVWKGLFVVGLVWLGAAIWGAWTDGGIHDAARAQFMTQCSAEQAVDVCERLVDRNDEGCLHVSGLLLDRPEGATDYARCLHIGEAAYRAERAARGARRRARRSPLPE